MISTGICRWLFLLISLSTWTRLTDSKEMRVVCYYTNWSIYRPGQAKFSPQNINPYLCTHLIYAFGGFTKENTLKPFDKYQDIEKGGYAKFTGLKTYNKNLKTMIAIGGWNEGSSRFSPMVANAERRKELVRNAIKFLRQNHFDGLDLDWEYPTFRDGGKPRDRDNYAQLVKELREEFERESEKTGRPRLLLTMAVPAGIEYINKGYDVPKLTKYLDWMNILSYDYHSAFEPAVNHHAPLYSLEEDNEYNYDAELNIDYTIKHYLKLGADPNKLVLGIPTYGRSYTLFNPDAYEIGSPADGPGDMGEATRENGYLAYYEICEYIKDQDWEVEDPNPNAMGPIAFKGNQWVGYDDENIVRKKAEYVAENSLGGIMFWAIDNDDFRGNCHGKPYPLIEAAKEALINAYGLTEENLISPPSKPAKSTKQKTRNRTRKTTTTSTERPEEVSVSTRSSSRRRRIKNKSKDEDRSLSSNVQKRRKGAVKNLDSSTYSSLKVITPAYTTPAPPATPDMGGAFKCEDEGFFPHPKDCKKYFWCLGGPGDTGIIAHQFTCPAGLYFNKGADSCDYSRNVLCNKKLEKATTTEKLETSSATTTTEKSSLSSIFSTSRAPTKITAATSRNTFRQTTTTEAYDDDYEYEDEEDGDDENKPEEDPEVLKELINLIKKAGGIEELEKHLHIGKDSSSFAITSDSTTPSTISKSLVERVLGKTKKNTLNVLKRTSANRNSGGPQGGGQSSEEVKEKKAGLFKPQYRTLNRQRPTTEKTESEDAAEKPFEEETVEGRKAVRSKTTLEYVNIRRPKSSSTTEAPEDDGFSRNKILGETDDETSDEDYEVATKKNVPQYVNIRRQRPSTTEATATSSKYASIRRSTVPPEKSDDEETSEESKYKTIRRGTTTEYSTLADTSTLKYQTIRRGPTTISPILDDESKNLTANVQSSETDLSDMRYNFISRSTTTPVSEDNSESTIKYQTIKRGTTPQSENLETVVSTIAPLTSSERASSATSESEVLLTTPQLETSSNLTSLATENIISSTPESITESNDLTSVNSESSSDIPTQIKEFAVEKKPPVLFQPRPFSVGTASTVNYTTAEPTTVSSKVSQTNLRFRLRQPSSATTSTTEAVSTTIRNRSRTRFRSNNRNQSEDKEQEEKYERTVENKPVRSRKRVRVTTERPIDYNEEYNRKYRPAEIADLSSLTAADFGLRGDSFISTNRRRRPTGTSTTTSTTEKTLSEFEKTGSRTLPLVRKLIDPSAFGKSRRIITRNEDQINASSERASSARKGSRIFRSTTPKADFEETASEANNTVLENGTKVAPRTRKIFRRVRPSSAPSTTSTKSELDETSTSSSTPRIVIRKRIPLFRSRQNRTQITLNKSEDEITEISENITSTEYPLLRLLETTSRFKIVKNSTSPEDDDDDEHVDVLNGEEGENFKLSESNIRESSKINAFEFNDKPEKLYSKLDLSEKYSDEKHTADDERSNKKAYEKNEDVAISTDLAPTDPTRILRTRKVIRKINTTEPSTTTASLYEKRRTNLRRPSILNINEFEAKGKDETTKATSKRYFGLNRSTTEANIDDDETLSPIKIQEAKSRRIFRPDVRKTTNLEQNETSEKNVVTRNRFRFSRPTTEDPRSTIASNYILNRRYPYSTTEEIADKDDDTVKYFDDHNEEVEREEEYDEESEDSEDTYDEETNEPNYTIYTTSVNRIHRYESNTNFDNENQEDVENGSKSNNSITSLVLTSALNSRTESETESKDGDEDYDKLNFNETSKESDNDNIESSSKRNNFFRTQKERPSFTRQKVSLSKEEVQTKSQKDILKASPAYRSKYRSTTEAVTPSSVSINIIEDFTPNSVPINITEDFTPNSVSINNTEDFTPNSVSINNTEDFTPNSVSINNTKDFTPYSISTTIAEDIIPSFVSTNNTNDSIAIVDIQQPTESDSTTTTPNIIETTTYLPDGIVGDLSNLDSEIIGKNLSTMLTINNNDNYETTLSNTEITTEINLTEMTDEYSHFTSERLNELSVTEKMTTESERNVTHLDDISTISTTHTMDSTPDNTANVTETTTEYQRRNTLRTTNARPRLPFSRRTTETSKVSSTTESFSEVSSKRTYTRIFNKNNRNKLTKIRNRDDSTLTLTTTPRPFSPLPINKLLYKYSSSGRFKNEPNQEHEHEEEEQGEEEDDYEYDQEEIDNGSNEEQDDELEEEEEISDNQKVEEGTKNFRSTFSKSTTLRVANKPVDIRKIKDTINNPKFTKVINKEKSKTTFTEDLINTEVIKNRNKNLFSKRKMNTPIKPSTSSPVVNITEDVSTETSEFIKTELTTTPTSVQTDSTDPNLTTLHHVFAEVESTDSTTESLSNRNSGKVERLIEVNRIVEVKTKEGKIKNQSGSLEVATKVEIVPMVDKIGEISRVTFIEIVDGNNKTILKSPESNEIGAILETTSVSPPDVQEITKASLEVAKVEEIPAAEVMQNVNLKNIDFKINFDKSGTSEREERRYEIFGESKVSDNKVIPTINGNPEVIDGISHIKIVTPEPLSIETSTISLQGLFQTERNHLNPSFTTNDEVLETGRSELVNVRILDQDRSVRYVKNVLGNTNLIPVKVLSQDEEEEVTMKAHVVEIKPKQDARTIKIVPIKVEMSRSIANFRLPINKT